MHASPNRARDLFLAAVRLAPDQWDPFLAAEGADDALRARVRDLLTAHREAGSFLDPAAALVATTDEPADERAGTVIGPYKLLEQIGEGGFGTVYMAEQAEPVRRKVALKVLKPGMDTRQGVSRFEAERQALALMDHPNIAQVFDGGQTPAGRLYFVMELVKGVPITRFCDDQRLALRDRLGLFVQVCQAVQHAHQKGVIHRDLKPSNVLVTVHDTTPVAKVIDFGVAKAVGPSLTDKTLFTGFAQMVGTPLYMSPEQAGQSGLDVDTRADIYSLGVLLYELLTGTTPFDRDRFRQAAFDEIRRIIREEDPPKPSSRLSESKAALPSVAALRHTEPARLTRLVRGELDWIVMKALEKDRDRRYESATGFAQDVQRYLADEPVRACPPSTVYRLKKFVRRNRGPVLAAALVLLALVGGMIGTTWGMVRATDARADAVDEAGQKEVALKAAQASERDARAQLSVALWSQARASRFSRRVGQRLDSLDALAQAAGIRPEERLRDEATAALALPDVRRVPGWHSSPPGTSAIAYGGQYRLYARVDHQGVISVRGIPDDREVRRIASGGILGSYLHFSPDDRHLLGLGEGYALGVWRVVDGQRVLPPDLRGCRAHAFSPDGRRLAVGQHDWLLVFDLETGREVNRWRIAAPAHTLAFHPDQRRVAVGHFDAGAASVYDAASGARVADLPVGGMRNQVVAWHPDGERLAVAGSDPRIQIWNVAARRQVATLEGHVQYVPALTFHPDGELLASHGWDGQLLLWDPSSGRQLLRLTAVSAPRFSPDGRWLGVAWHGGRADLLEVTPSREYRTLVSSAGAGRGAYNRSDVSPDGRLLAVGMDDGARLWDLGTGREVAVLPEGTTQVAFEGGRKPADARGRPRALLTGGSHGLLRWPVTGDPEGKGLRLGPPRQISPGVRAWFARSPDGRTLGAVTEQGGANKVLDLETGAVRRELAAHPPLGEVQALSGDGRWAASCGWASDQVRLWDVGTGRMVHEWVLGKRTRAFFTPDSRALVISRDDEVSLWDVTTLQPIRRLARDVAQFPGHVAFSPDGRLMALEMAPAVIHLMEVATGRTVARLEDPHGDRAGWLDFTPDGTRLVVLANLAHAIHVWDLRAVRARLKGMNLDWDWPEFEPPTGDPPVSPADPPPVVCVVDAERLGAWTAWRDKGRASHRAARWEEAINHLSRAIVIKPDDASCWYLRGSARHRLRLLDLALADYTRATELDPQEPTYWTSRGDLYAQQGQLRKAVADYSTAIDLKPDDAHCLHERGNARGKLGRWDQALADYIKASEVNPKEPTYWRRRGNAHAQLGHLDKAVADYSTAIELGPRRAYYWGLRAGARGRLGRWDQALADYATAAELEPTEPEFGSGRGFAHAQLGQWDQAAAAFEEATALRRNYPLAWHYLALSHLRTGDRTGYRAVCSRMLDRFDQSAGGEDAHRVAWTCVLAPAAVADWTKPLKLAEKAHTADGRSHDRINQLGAVLYRAGRFKEAAQRLAEAHDAFTQVPTPPGTIVHNWLFQAMTHYRLGNAAGAAQWLEKAVRAIDRPAAAPDAATETWDRSLTLRLLRREAEELLGKTGQ